MDDGGLGAGDRASSAGQPAQGGQGRGEECEDDEGEAAVGGEGPADGYRGGEQARNRGADGGIAPAARAMLEAYSPDIRAEVEAIMRAPWSHVAGKVGLVLDGVRAPE